MSRRRNLVSTYEAIRRQVWSEHEHANPKLVRAFVKRLRDKLGADTNAPAWIATERGAGYRMARPDEL